MWLVSKGKKLINMNLYQEVVVEGQNLVFYSNDKQARIINCDSVESANTTLTYILQAMKRKEEVVNL